MKKYLTMGAGALMLMMTASCTRETNLYDPQAVAEKLTNQYATSFEETVGKPNANQTWGFGDDAAGARMATRAIQPSYEFPDDADGSKFLAEVPDGVEKLTQNVGRANNYIDETWQGDLNIWGAATAEGNWQDRSGGTLYIKGNCDFSNRSFYFDGNSELFLLEGATLTLNANNAANLQTNTKIYVAKDAKIVTPAELKLNNGLHIYNHGTIEAAKLSTNSNSVLYNCGTVTITGKISVENTLSVIVNDGIITAADLNTAGSGKVLNNNGVTISGTTFVNSNDNTWVNNGLYQTGNFIYNAASDEVINNCRLIVDEDFNINLGDNPGNGNFKMDAGSSVVTKNFNGGGNWAKNYSTGWSAFNGGPFFIYMGSGSVFKVLETATMNATKADYGFYCTGSDWAVLQAKNIVAGTAGQGYEVTYGGKLAVVAETHFAQGYSGQYPYIDFKDGATIANIYAPGFNGDKPAISVPATLCNPGFNGGGGKTIKEQGRIICEDLGTIGDFDFNDVVFDAIIYTDGTTDITLLAAGGTLDLTVAGVEVHGEQGFNVGKTNDMWHMVNTGEPGYKPYTNHPIEKKDPVHFIAKEKYYRLIDIPIVVRKQQGENITYYQLTAEKGKAPQKICVPIGFKWDDEYISITKAYPAFKDWVEGEDPFDWNWIQSRIARFVDLDLRNNK